MLEASGMQDSAKSVLVGGRHSDAAIAWYVRLRDTAFSDEDRVAFADWLAETPRHGEEIAEIGRVDNAMGDVLRRQLASSHHYQPHRKSHRFTPSRRQVFAGFSGLAIAAAAGLAWMGDTPGLATAIGERRQFALADAGLLELDCGSNGSFTATAMPQTFHLDYGQAFISCERPLAVRCDFGAMQASAASFNLKIERRRALLSVLTGEVMVERQGGRRQPVGALSTIELRAATLGEVIPVPAEHLASWRRNRLIFERSALADVIDDINRYRPGHLLLAEPGLGDLKVTGDFDTRRADDAFAAILRTFRLRTLDVGGLVTLVLSA